MHVSGGSRNLDRLLGEFTAEELEGFKGFIRWISNNWDSLSKRTDLYRKQLKAVFMDFVPTKNEQDLERIFEAFGKDAPGMPLLKKWDKDKKVKYILI